MLVIFMMWPAVTIREGIVIFFFDTLLDQAPNKKSKPDYFLGESEND